MVERLLIAAIAIGVLVALIALGRRWYEARNARIETRLRAAATVTPRASGRPRIVYFTTKTCVVCRAQQEPALTALSERVPDLLIERYDAVEERARADEYGVLSVPTTAVYNRAGRLISVNRGYAPAAVLLAQVEDREMQFEAGAEMVSEPVA